MNNIFLTAEWRKLIMANYIIDPAILRPYLPSYTEIDYWDENCYISIVGFMFMNTRIKKYPIPFHRNFEEVNLRFYVRYKDGNYWKRGVVFIREFVPLPMVAWVANTIYDERYQFLPMHHNCVLMHDQLEVAYKWKKNKWHSISVEAKNQPAIITEGSKEEFITQHFWGYAKKRRYTSEYQVAHELWKSYPVTGYNIDVKFEDCYGSEFKVLDHARPDSVFLIEGSPIQVHRDKKLF